MDALGMGGGSSGVERRKILDWKGELWGLGIL